jgi:hypothetical protein
MCAENLGKESGLEGAQVGYDITRLEAPIP